jgi:hypothetical protein
LWGGDWGARKTYEQEIASGRVIDGIKTLEAAKALVAAGVSEGEAWDKAKVYKEASLWDPSSVVKQIPLPTDKFGLSLISNSEGVFYAKTTLVTETVLVDTPTYVRVAKRRYRTLSSESSCSTVVADPNSVPTDIDGMAVTRVVIKTEERSCASGESALGEQPFVLTIVKTPVVRQYARITTYPCY